MTFTEYGKIQTFDRLIAGCEKISIVSHVHPDGDAAGSTLALREFLEKTKGRDATVILPDTLPETLAFIADGVPSGRLLSGASDPEGARQRILDSDMVVCLDCNSFSRTGVLEESLRSFMKTKVLIDHHLSPESGSFDLVFSHTDVSSASELLFYMLLGFPEVGGKAAGLPAFSASAMMTGMTTDTNNFANSVFPSTLSMASALLDAGVDRDAILSDLYNNYGENRMRLMGYMLYSNMKITDDGLAFMVIRPDIVEEFSVREGDTEGFVNLPLSIGRVKMSILLRQDEGGYFRVSVRSRRGVSANACAMRYFHGGGHECAAGGRLFFPQDIASHANAEEFLMKLSTDFFNAEGHE